MSESKPPNGAAEAPGTGELGIKELEQYLDTIIKPNLLPSTFKVLKTEFGNLKEKAVDGESLLNTLIAWFSRFNPNVSEKLKSLHSGLYLTAPLPPPVNNPGGPAAEVISNTKSLIISNDDGPPEERAARGEMPTPTEEELSKIIHSAETLEPPKGSGLSGLIAMTAIVIPPASPVPSDIVREESAVVPRSEMETISNEAQIARLAMKMGERDLADEDTEDDDASDSSSRPTLIQITPDSLIERSQRPDSRPLERGKDAEPELFNDAENAWFEAGPKPKDADPRGGR